MKMNRVEVCFSPLLFPFYENKKANVVVVDILRATSAIVTAFHNGVKKLIPVQNLDEARSYKNKGFMVAAERDGQVLDFADFGNSPFNFTREVIGGKTLAYSTTNGTQAIHVASSCHHVVIGAYLNITSLKDWLIEQDRDVIILCAAWKNKFNLEDSLFAGALSNNLLQSGFFETICDSTFAAMDLWHNAKSDLLAYIEKVAQKTRLKLNGLDDAIPYCHTFDLSPVIPILEENYLIKVQNSIDIF